MISRACFRFATEMAVLPVGPLAAFPYRGRRLTVSFFFFCIVLFFYTSRKWGDLFFFVIVLEDVRQFCVLCYFFLFLGGPVVTIAFGLCITFKKFIRFFYFSLLFKVWESYGTKKNRHLIQHPCFQLDKEGNLIYNDETCNYHFNRYPSGENIINEFVTKSIKTDNYKCTTFISSARATFPHRYARKWRLFIVWLTGYIRWKPVLFYSWQCCLWCKLLV